LIKSAISKQSTKPLRISQSSGFKPVTDALGAFDADANWLLTDTKGTPLHTIPTFRVVLGADPDGVRLFVWKDGADFSEVPDYEERIAGWEYGQAAEVTRQNHYPDDARGDPDGKPGDLPERLMHIGDLRAEDRGTEGGKAKGKTPFGSWLDNIRQEYR
jgi:hypothetical protein